MSKYSKSIFGDEQQRAHYQAADINDRLILNLRDLNHVMRLLYEGKSSQKRILIILNKVKKITQRDLTVRLGIRPGSASEVLSKLEKAGLIIRTESEADRRTTNIELTEQGIQEALNAAGQRSRRHEEMFSCLSGSEKEALLSLLEKVNEDWTHRYRATDERKPGYHTHGHEKHCHK